MSVRAVKRASERSVRGISVRAGRGYYATAAYSAVGQELSVNNDELLILIFLHYINCGPQYSSNCGVATKKQRIKRVLKV